MRKYRKLFAFAASVMLSGMMSVSFTSCSSDDTVDITEVIKEFKESGAADILYGKLFYVIPSDSLENYKLPVATTKLLDVETEPNDYYSFREDVIDGKKYIVFLQKKPQDVPFTGMRVKVAPKGHHDMARNVVIIFTQRSKNATRAGDNQGVLTAYSDWIGKGTHSFGQVGNQQSTIFNFDAIQQLAEDGSEGYVTANTQIGKETMLYYSGSNFEETMENWGFTIGISGRSNAHTHSLGKGLKKVLGKSWSISGSLNFGMSQSISSSQSYEYYLSLILVRKAEMQLQMSLFDNADTKKSSFERLVGLTTNAFLEALEDVGDDNFDSSRFFDRWGTDIITQGLFGGYMLYIYGRAENAYESEVGYDGNASLKKSNPVNPQSGGDWYNVFKAKNCPYAQLDASATYNYAEYDAAARAVTYSELKGGSNTDGDPNEWLAGFSDPKNWTLISYRRDSDTPSSDGELKSTEDFESFLYPIEELMVNLVAGYSNYLGEDLTEEDMKALERIADHVNELIDAKPAYLEEKASQMTAKPRLVIADFMMKAGADGHENGEPKSFIDKDPRNPNKLLIYYPMMANPKNAPVDNGYAIETSQYDYVVGADYRDHYWYYALASEDDCDGIVDIIFSDDENDFYYKRGDHANYWVHVAANDNYVQLKYFDGGDPKTKITAIALVEPNNKKADVDHILASTGGSELKRRYKSSEYDSWKNWWDQEMKVSGDDYDEYWYEGANTNYTEFIPVYSTKDLPDNTDHSMKNICHPLKWGEKE